MSDLRSMCEELIAISEKDNRQNWVIADRDARSGRLEAMLLATQDQDLMSLVLDYLKRTGRPDSILGGESFDR